MQVPDNEADTLHSSLLDTQVETDKRRLVQEVSTKYRIVNRERETKQVTPFLFKLSGQKGR